MFVNLLSAENTDPANRGYDSTIREPTCNLIEEAIRGLDGKHRTVVILGRNDFEYMVVGGGKDNMYSCGLVDKRGQEFAVVDSRKAGSANVILPCGQPTAIAIQEVIDLTAASTEGQPPPLWCICASTPIAVLSGR